MNKEFNITYYDLPAVGIVDQQWLQSLKILGVNKLQLLHFNSVKTPFVISNTSQLNQVAKLKINRGKVLEPNNRFK